MRFNKLVLVLLIVVLSSPALLKSSAVAQVRVPRVGAARSEPVPGWVAWQVLYGSLGSLDKKYPADTRKMLGDELGLTNGEAGYILNRGNVYRSELKAIDDWAKAEAKRRYPPPPRLRLNGAPAQKTIRQRAIEDGLDAQVTAKRSSALATHQAELAATFGAPTMARLARLVETKVAPHITKLPDVDPRTAITNHRGTLPPGIKGDLPKNKPEVRP
jgi:hypothetical protein